MRGVSGVLGDSGVSGVPGVPGVLGIPGLEHETTVLGLRTHVEHALFAFRPWDVPAPGAAHSSYQTHPSTSQTITQKRRPEKHPSQKKRRPRDREVFSTLNSSNPPPPISVQRCARISSLSRRCCTCASLYIAKVSLGTSLPRSS